MKALFQKETHITNIYSMLGRAMLAMFIFCVIAFPAEPLKAQIKSNGSKTTGNSIIIEAGAKFSPAAHVQVEHGIVTSVASIEPASGNGVTVNSSSQQDIYASVIGGGRGDMIVVSCDVENGDTSETCRAADISGPQQVVQAGQTLRSNLIVQPSAARAIEKNDMTVLISFSYI